MDLSIIIVSFNTKKLTLACIDSIIKSKPKLKYEIIVVDNASTDGTVEAIRKSKILATKYKILINKVNLGFSKANNIGINVAKGKYVLLLNSDTEVTKHSLDKLVNFAKKNPDAGVIGPKLLNTNGSTQNSVFKFPTVIRAIKQYWMGQSGYFTQYAPKSRKSVEVEAIVAAAFLITPKALRKIGLLDERYFMYFEDLEYCHQVKKSNLKVYYLPTAEVVHHLGASGKNLSDKANQWRRLIPSSKIYHGLLKHYLISFILWSGQKLGR